jgi:hypothetical protein
VGTGNAIPRHALIACQALGPKLGAQAAGEAIAAGLLDGGASAAEILALPASPHDGDPSPAGVLEELRFDERMRAARAVVIVVAALRESAPAGSLAFEIATRARQSGVPCYAVAASDELDAFDARILDLQVVSEAGTRRDLRAAGRRLAKVL